jgi:hypothetical protein
VPRIARTLQELVEERVIEVLPALQCLFLEKLYPSRTVQEEIAKFLDARKLAEHPITVSFWEREQDDESKADGSLLNHHELKRDGRHQLARIDAEVDVLVPVDHGALGKMMDSGGSRAPADGAARTVTVRARPAVSLSSELRLVP